MAGVNVEIKIGNLGADPDFRVTPSGTEVCKFSVAVTTKRGKEEQTEWVNAVAFNRLAEICRDYLRKGSRVYLRGRGQLSSWQHKEYPVKMYRHELLVDEMQMLDSKNSSTQAPGREQAAPGHSAGSPAGFDGPEDDIPF